MIRQAGSPRRWIGLSIDQKPVPGALDPNGIAFVAEDVTPGSTFFETDTLTTAVWNGSSWVPGASTRDTQQPHFQTIADELLRIRRLLEEAHGLSSDDLLL